MASIKSNSKSKPTPIIIKTGTENDDILKGTGKNEIFYGLSGTDTISYAYATSAVIADLEHSKNNKGFALGNIYSQIENLVGSSFNDKLFGNSSKNTLDGGRGKDILSGRDGDDTYLVDLTVSGKLEDTVIESSNKGSGFDTIKVRGSYNGSIQTLILNPNIERLDATDITGTGLINLSGNERGNILLGNETANLLKGFGGNDSISGNGGKDILMGGDGNDVLNGGSDNDDLSGGKGRDTFVFSTKLSPERNIDIIRDFEIKSDVILLDCIIFNKLSSKNALSASQFVTSETITIPEDQDNYIYYDKSSGGLFYDEDGSGSGAMVQFATVANMAALTYEDFKIIPEICILPPPL